MCWYMVWAGHCGTHLEVYILRAHKCVCVCPKEIHFQYHHPPPQPQLPHEKSILMGNVARRSTRHPPEVFSKELKCNTMEMHPHRGGDGTPAAKTGLLTNRAVVQTLPTACIMKNLSTSSWLVVLTARLLAHRMDLSAALSMNGLSSLLNNKPPVPFQSTSKASIKHNYPRLLCVRKPQD